MEAQWKMGGIRTWGPLRTSRRILGILGVSLILHTRLLPLPKGAGVCSLVRAGFSPWCGQVSRIALLFPYIIKATMKLLIYAGIIYLAGVSAMLLVRPTLVFREDGSWKEFGIGRDPENYTWMPFWLFAILWAMLSYMFTLLLASANLLPGIRTIEEQSFDDLSPRQRKKAMSELEETPPGYYMLNVQESGKKGVPKYVYLGPSPPNLVYNARGESME